MAGEVKNESGSQKTKPILLSWESPEFIVYQKTIWWYLAAALIFLALLVYSVITKDWMMLAVFLIAALVIFQYSQTKPKIKETIITEEEVQVGERVYPYGDLRSFWIASGKEGATLYLQKKNRFSSLIPIRISDQNPDKIKEVLSQYLILEPIEEEDILDRISRLLRF